MGLGRGAAPGADVPRRPAPRDHPLPKALDDAAAAKLLRAAQNDKRLLVRVTVEMLLRTGLRVSEYTSLREARALLKGGKADGLAPDDLAEAVAAELGIPVVVVTLGEAGCVTYAAGISHRYPAHKAAVVDATGAGDAFMATFCAYVVEGMAVAGAVDAAQSAAAWAVGHPGGRQAMPSPDSAR